LKQRQYIFKGGNHLRIDFPQLAFSSAICLASVANFPKSLSRFGMTISKPFWLKRPSIGNRQISILTLAGECPLSGVKRTTRGHAAMSAPDPLRTLEP
jgi:hypothetical protein